MSNPRTGRIARALLALAVSGLVLTASAAAAKVDPYKVRFTPAGQKAARADVILPADLGSTSGWTGGATKASIDPDPPCANFHPKHSDLVVVGASSSEFQHSGLQFDSDVQVMQSKRMAELDWQRSQGAPHYFECGRETLRKSLPAGQTFRSFERISIPKLGEHSGGFRMTADVKTSAGTVRVAYDIFFATRGKTEIVLLATTPVGAIAVVHTAGLVLLHKLVARAAV